jgi:glutamate racemase
MVNPENKQGSIGIFDSGYGGLTVLSELTRLMPSYDFLYIGDNARTPYGTRSFETVYQYTFEAVRKFFELGAHLVILACNTASAKALRNIQQNDLPRIAPHKRVLGIIRPSVEAVTTFTQSQHVGILGTPGTIASGSYVLEIAKVAPQISVVQEACPMWVPLVEYNELTGSGADYFVQKHINAILERDPKIDTLVLGCTHYPLLLPTIRKHTPQGIQILAQGEIVANSLINYLERHPEIDKMCRKNAEVQYFTTETISNFVPTAESFCGKKIDAQHISLQ